MQTIDWLIDWWIDVSPFPGLRPFPGSLRKDMKLSAVEEGGGDLYWSADISNWYSTYVDIHLNWCAWPEGSQLAKKEIEGEIEFSILN